jgi:transcriptional regulator with XRE-family HTH domain
MQGASDDFATKLLRLKEALRVESDKEVAELLGLKPSALNARKKRGSFPETDLLALIAKRPDLNIDATYVLSGKRLEGKVRESFDRMYRSATQARLDRSHSEQLVLEATDAAKSYAAVSQRRRPEYEELLMLLNSCNDDDFGLVMQVATKVYLAGLQRKAA